MKKTLLIAAVASVALVTNTNAQNIFPDSGITSGKVGIFNCDAAGNKQATGAVLGAIIGGYAGNRLMKKDKTLGTVLGAAIGGAAGSYIGCRLQRADQEKLAKDGESALVNGKNYTFTNDETGITGTTNTVSDIQKTKADVKFATNVTAPTSLSLLGAEYSAKTDIFIKAAPNATAKTIGSVASGEVINVLGKTGTKTQWAAILNNGAVSGYVPLTSLSATGRMATINEADTQQLRTISVPVTSVCRSVTQSVSQNGKIVEDGAVNKKACVQADGSWQTI